MRQGNGVSPESRESWLARPAPALLFALGTALVASAALLAVVRACRDRALLTTGEARWIWCSRDIRGSSPVRFYATREFVLQEVPRRATARVFVDRGWQLFVNGSRVAGGEQGPGDRLQVLEVAASLKHGENRLTIQAESPTGVGGILFSLELDGSRKSIVSDASWRVDFSDAARIGHGGQAHASEWGRPPIYPWGYPRPPAFAGGNP